MSLPRHAAYKESGLEWISEIPAHWQSPVALGSLSSLKGRLGWQGLKADEYQDEGPYVVSSAQFSEFKVRWNECPRVSQARYAADGNIQLEEGDVLLMKDGAAMGKLAYVDHLPGRACLNSHLLLFRPRRRDGMEPSYIPKFAFYFMQTALFQEFIKVNGTGATFLGISQEAISRFRVAWPDIKEQREIAKFLDFELAKIDALIGGQQRLIALLSEKRETTISRALTRGLDRDAPMMYSGATWLGSVPATWKVERLKRLTVSIEQGWSPQCESYPAEGDGEWGVVKVGCVNGGVFQPLENKKLPSELMPDASLALRRGDLLVSRANTRQLVGSAAVVPREFPRLLLCDKIYRLRLHPSLCIPEFAAAFLGTHEARGQLELNATGASSSMLNIGQSAVLELLIPLPPVDEQRRIIDVLDRTTGAMSALVAQAEDAIALLKERRSALITAAVTGQIDVRNAVPRTASDPEPLAA